MPKYTRYVCDHCTRHQDTDNEQFPPPYWNMRTITDVVMTPAGPLGETHVPQFYCADCVKKQDVKLAPDMLGRIAEILNQRKNDGN